jgi:cytochrome c556
MRKGLIALLAIGTAGIALAQANVIAERRDGLRQMGRHVEAIGTVVQARGDVRPLTEPVRYIADFSRRMSTLFPPGSGQGDTRALPAIWTDRPTFDARLADFQAAAERLVAVQATGDAAAFATQFQATAATCGACHRAFRGR